MSDLIDRQAEIDAISTWDKFGVDERGRIVRWHEGLEPYVHLRDVVTAIVNLPSAQPEIIRCKDCKHRPVADDDWQDGFDIEFPDNRCPCQCDDEYYNWLPDDDWFCGNAERRTDDER